MLRRVDRKSRNRGQTMTEYIIIVALIAIASIAIVTIFSNQIRALFAGSAEQLSGDTGATVTDMATDAKNKEDRSDLTDWQ